jgi:HlyD family secretion protein
MKRIFAIILILVFLALVGLTFRFLWKQSQVPPTTFTTELATTGDIIQKTVATGSIVPRQEVEIKPRVSGVIEQLFVEPGKLVKQGDQIAKIQIIPDAAGLNRAQSEVRSAQIAADNAARELARNQDLFAQGVIAEAELARYRTEHALRKAELSSAGANLQIVKEGQTRGGGKTSNVVVVSTVNGMVIDVPVKVGYSVIESNNFNPGTTIAFVADMDDMIFQGHLDESEVGKVKEGMALQIKVGAIEDQQFDGKLEYVAPKGTEIDGAIQFEIKAAIVKKPGVFIRAGYSANADVVLDKRTNVLRIREAVLSMRDGKSYVEVETGPQQFAEREVQVGLSDGINIEVKGGITAADKLKIPGNAGPAGMPGAGKRGGGGPPRR